MSEIISGDARFPRARCEHCGNLYPADQTAIYQLTRLADNHSRRVRLCFVCAHTTPKHFSATKLENPE